MLTLPDTEMANKKLHELIKMDAYVSQNHRWISVLLTDKWVVYVIFKDKISIHLLHLLFNGGNVCILRD